jgi:glycosyltransferase involved in cell wall biosynthesis
MSETPALSVVMITLNEEAAVASVVKKIRQVIKPTEILIVDSSTDKTANIAASLGCRVIRQYPAIGYGPAVGDVIVTLDCDDTYPADAIIELLQHIEAGYDIVSASRIMRRPRAMPAGNYIANVIFAKLAGVICGIKTSDLHTGMRAYRKSCLENFQFDAEGMALPVELLIGPVCLGYRFKEIGIDYYERTGQSKLRPIQGTYWTLKRLWKWRRR